ncbi:MAG: type II toxin-antitoxin system PemK/MazF family toxin [Streptosporangiaceae bacterium]
MTLLRTSGRGASPRCAVWTLTRRLSSSGGVRPAIVVGSTTHCRCPIGMALVVPLTAHDRGLHHHVRIASAESGLPRPSWARTEDLLGCGCWRGVHRGCG